MSSAIAVYILFSLKNVIYLNQMHFILSLCYFKMKHLICLGMHTILFFDMKQEFCVGLLGVLRFPKLYLNNNQDLINQPVCPPLTSEVLRLMSRKVFWFTHLYYPPPPPLVLTHTVKWWIWTVCVCNGRNSILYVLYVVWCWVGRPGIVMAAVLDTFTPMEKCLAGRFFVWQTEQHK
jgi:hypothetical protein